MVMVTGGNTFPPKVLLSPLGSIEEEDDSVLDEYILDDSSQPTEMAASSFSPPHNVFASPTYLQAHEDESWSSYPISFAAPTFNAVNNPATTQPPHPAQNGMPHDAAGSYPMYGEHPASWQPINIGHGHSHGMPNGLSSPYDIKAEEPTTNSMMLPPNGVPVSTSHDPSQFGQSIASPQSENGWVSTSSTSDQPNKFPSQDTTHRTSFATFPSHLRREGIRKKNARVEIPDGRTIDTIEEEIKMCDPNDEAKLKELKQYKRLLRNREAALSSRSRKKEHAQRLEEENKVLVANEESMKLREAYWVRECRTLTDAVEKYRAREEELIRRHTLETADLRKRISFLDEEVQRRGETPLSAAPTSATFSSGFPDYEAVTMNGNQQWEDFSFAGQPGMAAEMQKPAESTLLARQKEVKPSSKEEESSVSGLLLMLLMCGAWVASSSGNSKPATVPEMSEDVRAASAAVLTNIYKDAGLQPQDGKPPTFNNPAACGPGPTERPRSIYASSSFDPHSMHQMLTSPSRQQQQDQAFSLTAEQYNHITTDWLGEQSKQNPPVRRRNLADALANLHLGKRTTATDAYTKSLLVGEVPANVVRDFHRMVAERNAGQMQHNDH